MTMTLTDGTTTVNLNEDLHWSDENWLPVVSTTERTLTGALLVQVSTMTGGRPITLQPFDDESGWMPYGVVQILRNWAAVPGKVLTLTMRGQSRSVIFRHADGAVEAAPVVYFNDVQSSDWQRVVMRFMEMA